MDTDLQSYTLPVSAIRSVRTPSGLTMEQAVPDTYVLANFVLRALLERNDREIEFIVKAYLPVSVINYFDARKVLLVEPLGFTSTSFKLLTLSDFRKTQDSVSEIKSPSILVQVMRELADAVSSSPKPKPMTYPGLISDPLATRLLQLETWPTVERSEPHSVELPALVEKKQAEEAFDNLRMSIESLISARKTLPEILDVVRKKVDTFLGSVDTDQVDTIARLDARIESLSSTIDDLNSRYAKLKSAGQKKEAQEVAEIMKKRESARERDKERVAELVSSRESLRKDLATSLSNLEKKIAMILPAIESSLKFLDSLPGLSASSGQSFSSTTLMLPFFVVGFSARGKLTISVYPPSKLEQTSEKLGRRVSFIDSLEVASPSVETVRQWLSEVLRDDLTLREFLRESSPEHNLLAVKTTRRMIRSGAESLVSEGLLKESTLSDIDSLLEGVPEREVRMKVPRKKIKDENACNVRFLATDETGAPVESARLEIGNVRLRTDSQGMIRVLLPLGYHEGLISHEDFERLSVDFTLDSIDDVVIPVVLRRLPSEDRLDRQLDRLIERADRIDKIRERLWEAFQKQGETLVTIPAYRASLSELLSELGFEPEAWIAKASKKKGMVRRLLKRDDRKAGLRRDILRLAEESRQAGGLMLMSEFLVRLDDLGWDAGHEEVYGILDDMSREGLIEGIESINGGARLVKFIPVELTDDPQKLLGLATEKDGRLTIEAVVVELGWPEERVEIAMNLLVEKGVAKIQESYSTSTVYWFPGLRRKK
ncbi:MAG: hypothetical protein JSW61_09585 [Candidatus Thorarchaeota archaeon]|nr:MAG: hypothetical protein JSW61_09585 [Candidatus Thorarchaeota archaeon]